MKTFTPEEMLTRWEARREIQNVMGKVSQSYLMMEEAQIYDRWWSKREDVCLGVNEGWYQGKDAVKGYYDALGRKIQLASDIIAATFPDKLGGKTREELYGVGQLGVKPIDTFVIEIAGDGQTAKGLWSLHGTYADMTPSGPVSYWDWGYWCVDFLLEDGAWKIWHMLDLHEVDKRQGLNLTDLEPALPEDPAFAEMASVVYPAFTVPCVLRETYRADRPFSPSPRVPEPYRTFADTFSYGV